MPDLSHLPDADFLRQLAQTGRFLASTKDRLRDLADMVGGAPMTCADAALRIEQQFQPGRLVWLKSGGPPMTVTITSSTDVTAAWFDSGGRLEDHDFQPDTLTTNRPLLPGDMF